ncbi:hypothetical protein BX265_0863 [Streptomyces sp. TLI_235]|nr:hypothetical protein [Streptomyces sp. TLI_235]PBC76160.1 hypothetical protein BX265_0863 [Streptomyces sp. TLI_235]
MTASVTLHPDGPYFLRRTVTRLLPRAAHLVESHMRESMPATLVRLAHPADFGRAVVESVGGTPSWWRAAKEREHHRRTARDAQGLTVPTAEGTVLVLLHIAAMDDRDQLYPTLVHELVHAVQMGRPATAADTLARNRHHLGLEHRSRRWLATHDASIARDEDEAYRIEHLITAA